MREPLIIGNWKLNGSTYLVSKLITSMRRTLECVESCSIAIAPPVMYLNQARYLLVGSRIALGAQNVDINLSGAFTGEISANMLKDVGAKYVIIGHSERRIYHKETNEAITKKFAVLKAAGLIPVLCIGETKAENAAGKTEEICSRQIDSIIKTLGVSVIRNAVIAYEPIWAIGTNKSASPARAQVVHHFIRNHIAQHDPVIAAEIIIQYGGSVNDKNAIEFFAQPDIDGVLVGGASLNSDIFTVITKAAATKQL